MTMIDVFTGIILLALLGGGGFLVVRHLLERRQTMTPPLGMPGQQGEEEDPRDAYGRGFTPTPGYDGSGYGRSMYGPGYLPPQTGMNPWAAGGLGAVGGGLLGYGLGRMAGEHEQQAHEGDTQNSDQTATLAQDGREPGMADALGTFDAGGFSDIGEDFGSGDFGGGSDW